MIQSKRAPVFDSTDLGKTLVFVYGTLMDARTRDYVLKHKEPDQKVKAVGYKRKPFRTPEGTHYDTLEPSTGHILEGDLLKVNSVDLDKLKKWEDQYSLQPIKLADGRQAMYFKLARKDELQKE